MALFECNFFSETLQLSTSMLVILPQGQAAGKPVLYLLHGRSDDHTIWVRRTSVERYVEGLNLIVVMPNVHRSYYADMVHGGRYWAFISEEVPNLVHDWFAPARDREATFAAGLSMGGYGAFKLALSHPERFAAAASLSGALDVIRSRKDEADHLKDEWWNIFGDPGRIAGSSNDLFALAKSAARADHQPRFYQCCGKEDWLYPDNLRFRDHARALGLDLKYSDGPGDHNWAYWDAQIQEVLEWLPIPP